MDRYRRATGAGAFAQTPQLLIDGKPGLGVSSNPTSFGRCAVDGTVTLIFDDGVRGTQLWQSDGTSVGTVRITVASPTGEWNGAVALPNQPSLIGLDLVIQALFVDGSLPLGFDAGDAHWLSLGS